MVRQAPGAGQARVYDVSGHVSASLGASLGVGARSTAAEKRDRRKRALADRDTDLLHDFAFPTVSSRVKLSPDGRYVYASGTYPPQIHVYDTDELSLKFKRHVAAEIVDFQVLEDDWRKFALLTVDRYVDLHSQYGSHFRTRVPRPGRDLMLHRGTCDLFVCGAGADVWRLNLEQGRFLAPLVTTSGGGGGGGGGNNVCGISPVNSLLAFGGEAGTVDVWDPRVLGVGARPAGTVDVARALAAYESSRIDGIDALEVTALRFDDSDGVSMAVGTSTGHTLLFDLRSPHAALVRDQGYGGPVKSLKLHRDGRHCVSADAKSIKVWDRATGVNTVAVEPDADVNHVCLVGASGVMCAAAEDSRVRSYYVPALGPAPHWCAFLDTFTEELEEAATGGGTGARSAGAAGGGGGAGDSGDGEVYENYKFVARDELEGLGLGHLQGTDMLKPYMHGFFVHMRLYRRALDAASPFAYEQYRKDRAREKVEADRESRIGKTRKRSTLSAAKVNRSIAEQLARKQAASAGKKGETAAAAAASILDDDRFSAMFRNSDFRVDEGDERFQHLNPSGVADGNPASGTRGRGAEDSSDDSDAAYLEQFDAVEEGAADGRAGGRLSAARVLGSDDDDDGDDGGSGDDAGDSDGGDSDGGDDRISKPRQKKRPRMFELSESAQVMGGHVRAPGKRVQHKRAAERMSLGKRVAAMAGGPGDLSRRAPAPAPARAEKASTGRQR
jgi:ribosome biogenesis protein ENP2